MNDYFFKKGLLERLALARDMYYFNKYDLRLESEACFCEVLSHEKGLIQFNYFDETELFIYDLQTKRIGSLMTKENELFMIEHIKMCQE